MSGSKRISDLTVTTTLSGNDRVLVLTNPATSAQTQTTTLTNLASKLATNFMPAANTTAAGVVKVGNNLSVNSSGFLNGGLNDRLTNGNNTVVLNSNGILHLPNTVGDIYRDGVSVIMPVMLSPNIAYTGVFNGYPASLPVTKGQAIFFTSNSYVLETSNKYWLATRFNNNDFDISGAQTIDLINIGGIQGDFRIGGKSETLLTDVDLHDVAVITDYFYVRDLPALQSFNANNLSYVGDYFQIDNMDNANTQFDFSNLKTIKGTFYYTWNDTLENTPQFPALETINNSMYIYYNTAIQNTMTFDSLRYVGYTAIYQNSGMIDGPVFPALTSIGYFDMYDNDYMINPPQFPALVTATSSFYFYNHNAVTTAPATPSLVSANYIGWYDNTSMVSGFDFSSIKQINGDVNISNCALNEASVDYILVTLANLDGTNGTTSYDNRNVYLHNGTNAIPSATGLAAKATLEARGCTVYVNS